MPSPPDRAAWTPVVWEVWRRAQVSGPRLDAEYMGGDVGTSGR